MSEPEKRVKADELSSLVSIPKTTLSKLARAGEIPATKVGRSWTFSPSRIQEWLREQEERNLCRGAREKERIKTLRIASPVTVSGGRKSTLMASDIDSAYARVMQGKQRGVLRR